MNTVTPVNPRPRVAPTSLPATVTAIAHPFASVRNTVNDSRVTNSMPNSAPVTSDELGFLARPSSEGDERQQTDTSSTGPRRRSRTASAVPASNRFTITNMTDNEIPEDSSHVNAPGSASTPPPLPQTQSSRQNRWLSAEEEKAKLYREAKERVEHVQGGLDRSESVQVCLLSYSVSRRV